MVSPTSLPLDDCPFMYIIYNDNGFDFLNMRIEQDDGFTLYGLDKNTIKLKDYRELNTFIDIFEVTSINYLSNRGVANYGTLMRIYPDEDGVHLWYNKQNIVIDRNDMRRLCLTLKRLGKRWKVLMAEAEIGEMEDGFRMTYNI